MQTNPYATSIEYLDVNGKQIATDQEGYIQNMDDWSEAFVRALAEKEGLPLNDDHWDIIWYIRAFNEEKRVQPTVRHMLKHFRDKWEDGRGDNHYLHVLFPRGGPQKQGNRLAGVRRTKGEH